MQCGSRQPRSCVGAAVPHALNLHGRQHWESSTGLHERYSRDSLATSTAVPICRDDPLVSAHRPEGFTAQCLAGRGLHCEAHCDPGCPKIVLVPTVHDCRCLACSVGQGQLDCDGRQAMQYCLPSQHALLSKACMHTACRPPEQLCAHLQGELTGSSPQGRRSRSPAQSARPEQSRNTHCHHWAQLEREAFAPTPAGHRQVCCTLAAKGWTSRHSDTCLRPDVCKLSGMKGCLDAAAEGATADGM